MFFEPLDVLGPLKVKGCQMHHFKESGSRDQRGTLACLRPQNKAELKPKSQISSSFHHTVSINCPLLGPIALERSRPVTHNSLGGGR